jgi:hypothetical protein
MEKDRTSTFTFSALCGEVENPKSQALNPKWFDQLTTLSHIEGQSPMIQIQMTKTVGRWFSILNIGAFVL